MDRTQSKKDGLSDVVKSRLRALLHCYGLDGESAEEKCPEGLRLLTMGLQILESNGGEQIEHADSKRLREMIKEIYSIEDKFGRLFAHTNAFSIARIWLEQCSRATRRAEMVRKFDGRETEETEIRQI